MNEWINEDFDFYLLSTYHMSGPVLGAEDIAVNKIKQNPCLQGAYILEGKTVDKQNA